MTSEGERPSRRGPSTLAREYRRESGQLVYSWLAQWWCARREASWILERDRPTSASLRSYETRHGTTDYPDGTRSRHSEMLAGGRGENRAARHAAASSSRTAREKKEAISPRDRGSHSLRGPPPRLRGSVTERRDPFAGNAPRVRRRPREARDTHVLAVRRSWPQHRVATRCYLRPSSRLSYGQKRSSLIAGPSPCHTCPSSAQCRGVSPSSPCCRPSHSYLHALLAEVPNTHTTRTRISLSRVNYGATT